MSFYSAWLCKRLDSVSSLNINLSDCMPPAPGLHAPWLGPCPCPWAPRPLTGPLGAYAPLALTHALHANHWDAFTMSIPTPMFILMIPSPHCLMSLAHPPWVLSLTQYGTTSTASTTMTSTWGTTLSVSRHGGLILSQ
jgi:hypothetical protein